MIDVVRSFSQLLAQQVVEELTERRLTVATAESLTGGGVGALLTSVPGSSAVYLGGVVSYATEVKVRLLGVPESLVARDGVVSAACAEAMALGVRTLLGTQLAVATTGVAGPTSQEGRPVGSVHVAVADGTRTTVASLSLSGDRDKIRAAASDAALRLLLEHLGITAGEVGRLR